MHRCRVDQNERQRGALLAARQEGILHWGRENEIMPCETMPISACHGVSIHRSSAVLGALESVRDTEFKMVQDMALAR